MSACKVKMGLVFSNVSDKKGFGNGNIYYLYWKKGLKWPKNLRTYMYSSHNLYLVMQRTWGLKELERYSAKETIKKGGLKDKFHLTGGGSPRYKQQ